MPTSTTSSWAWVYDKRIGQEFLRPGPGWGGSCFPKDSHALVRIAPTPATTSALLEGVVQVNDEQFERVLAKTVAVSAAPLDGATIAVWGLTFKARTDDLRTRPRSRSPTGWSPPGDPGTRTTREGRERARRSSRA